MLPKPFFNRPVLLVAPELLGKYLVRNLGNRPFDAAQDREVRAMIIEVEAYDGPEDRACHARSGKTKRNTPMFAEGGTIYVYITYGMHWMLNLVTGKRGYPAAVLIRAIQPTNQHSDILENVGMLDGPGKLTKALKINGKLTGRRLGKASGLWVEDRGVIVSQRDIQKTPRIGVSYAGAWAKKPYRFVLHIKN